MPLSRSTKHTWISLVCKQHSTRYYYKLGEGKTAREFWFKTPPKVGPDVPYIFGVIGNV